MADVPIAVAVPIHNPAAPAVPGTVIAPAHNPAAPAVPGTVIAPAAANEFSQEEQQMQARARLQDAVRRGEDPAMHGEYSEPFCCCCCCWSRSVPEPRPAIANPYVRM